jgi:hypothetical protein
LSDTAIDFLYLSEPDMIAAGVTDMSACVDAMEQTFALAVGVTLALGITGFVPTWTAASRPPIHSLSTGG